MRGKSPSPAATLRGANRRTPLLRILFLGCASAALAACGGGGGGSSIRTPAPPPSPAPAPPPSPTPAPPPTDFDTAEVARSDGPQQHDAISVWEAGTTGEGERIAIIDTGIDLDNPEFAGRIDSRSTYVAGTGNAQDVDDHGTHVALVAAGAFNQRGVVGIAFDSQIPALRADRPGTCNDSSDASLDGCRFAEADLANAVDRARNANATVINLSLGGSNPGQRLRETVSRAAADGIVIVVSAGNDGGSSEPGIDPDNPDRFATGLLEVGGDNVIIVGSVDENNNFSDFSNAAGDFAGSFIAARGEEICCIYENGELRRTARDGLSFVTVFSGTSFAAPQVSGAVALLAQAFPNLTGAEIVEIILESARDAGAAGSDTIYGQGILDIGAAFAPIGTTRMAGSATSLQLADDAAIGSGAMGDALAATTLDTIVLDKYDRAFGFKLGSRLRGASPEPLLHGVVGSNGRRVAAGSDRLSLAFTVGAAGSAGDGTALQPLRLTQTQADGARVLAGRLSLAVADGTRAGLAFGERGEALAADLQGRERPAFLIAQDTGSDTGFARTGKMSLAVRHELGPVGMTVGVLSGEAILGAARRGADVASRRFERFGTQGVSMSLDHRTGPLTAVLGASLLGEDRTILGGYWHDAFGVSGADTLFLDGALGLDAGDGWRIGSAFRQGITRPRGGGMLAPGATISSNAFSLDVAKSDAFTKGDAIALRFSQPLRVTGGGLDLILPVAYDYAAESAVYNVERLSLAPAGREMMGELSWTGSVLGGAFISSIYLRSQPGHYADAPDDAGLVLRWNRQF
ncbi:S8 family serine peptidase [Erythrobacteraceae bacterium WH01K]|nr:S8 family serine peptidase [Erythrobacteraceae bacterium WH01K]